MAGNRRGDTPLGDKGATLRTHGNGYARAMRVTEETLTEAAKVRRRLFVAHYIETTDIKAAATFAGFKSPASKGCQLLKEPYTQHLLRTTLARLDDDAIMTANEILFQAKLEALDYSDNNKSGRIAALTLMAKMRQLLIERNEHTFNASGNIMIVPAMTRPEEWGAMAAESQEKLKGSVRD